MQVAQRVLRVKVVLKVTFVQIDLKVNTGNFADYSSQDSDAPVGFANSLKLDCTTAEHLRSR